MSDYAPPSAQNQAAGPRRSLYVVLALPGGLLIRVSRRLRAGVSWLFPRADDQTRRRRVPGLLDPAQVEAAIAALRAAVARGPSSIPSLTQRLADSDWSGGDDDQEEGGHPSDRHLWYPPIRSLEAEGARLFLVSGPTGSGVPDDAAPRRGDARHANGLRRLSDVHDNTWILNSGTEPSADPCELTNETTLTLVTRLKVTAKLVGLSKQQLHEQNWELCEEQEEQCFAEVAVQSLEQLLDVACSFSDAIWFDIHISQQLTVFDALVDVLFNIQDLRFNRSGEVAGIINKMVNAFKGVIQRTSNDNINSSKLSTIHPATFVFIQVLEFFCRNRDMVQSILESGDYNTGPCSDVFNCLVSKLEEVGEFFFQEKGQRYIFVLNNIYYVLQKKCHPELELLPRSLADNLDLLIEKYIMIYLDECWFPLILSYLEGDSLKKPCRSSLKKFIEELEGLFKSQETWKVQTVLKGMLREQIVDLIVPKYVNFLKALEENPSSRWPSWVKGVQRARSETPTYTGPQLRLVIRGLFER